MPGMAGRVAAVRMTHTHPRHYAIAHDFFLALVLWTTVFARYAAGVLYEIAATERVGVKEVCIVLTQAAAQHAALLAVYLLFATGFTAFDYAQPTRVRAHVVRRRRARCDSDFYAADGVRSDTPCANACASATALCVMVLFYLPIAPYIEFVAAAWLGAVFPASNYRVCYTARNRYEGDGVLFTAALWQLLGGAVVAHVGSCAFLGLSGEIARSVIAGVPILVLVCVVWWLRR